MAYREFDTLPDWRALDTRGTAPQWAAEFDPPAIGSRVVLTVNGIGPGVVLGYFVEGEPGADFLGVRVQPDNPPPWYVKQNGAGTPCGAFGPELRPEAAPWYVVRMVRESGDVWGRGHATPEAAFAFGLARLADGPAQAVRFAVFDGQPSDGARVVCRFDPAGLPA